MLHLYACVWLLSVSAAFAYQEAAPPAASEERRGLILRAADACDGYTLFAPLRSNVTYLVDMDGRIVHEWKSDYPPGQSVYLLDDGHLLRCGQFAGDAPMRGGGEGGRIQEFDWDGNLLWDYAIADAHYRQHHDIEPMPNGNVLVIVWESRTKSEALAKGRDTAAVGESFWPDAVLEIEPVRPSGGKVVWEWHVWDHLIQDRDEKLAGFGRIAEHPELLDINVGRSAPATEELGMSEEERARLKELGYIGADDESAAPRPPAESRPRNADDNPEPGRRPRGDGTFNRGGRGGDSDWNHVNAIDYNAELDQVLLSAHNQHEIWIIDHSTTTAQAMGHSGGRCGKGGDFLYRWGNPANYQLGTRADQRLSGQHDARWIDEGLLGAGDILVFNNNAGGGERRYSEVVEITPPLMQSGYSREGGRCFEPAQPTWSYSDPEGGFYSALISGAQRLPNDHTLICSGMQGRVFEVTPEGDVVWDFINPIESRDGPGGAFGGGRGPRPDRRPRPEGEPADAPRAGPPDGREPPTGEGGERDRPPFPGAGRFGPGGPGGFGGPGGPMGNMQIGMFRATRVPKDHPALAGRSLTPKAPTQEPQPAR